MLAFPFAMWMTMARNPQRVNLIWKFRNLSPKSAHRASAGARREGLPRRARGIGFSVPPVGRVFNEFTGDNGLSEQIRFVVGALVVLDAITDDERRADAFGLPPEYLRHEWW
jgi:hypothetical protein